MQFSWHLSHVLEGCTGLANHMSDAVESKPSDQDAVTSTNRSAYVSVLVRSSSDGKASSHGSFSSTGPRHRGSCYSHNQHIEGRHWVANSRSATQENLRFLWDSLAHYHIHDRLPTNPILSQMNPLHILYQDSSYVPIYAKVFQVVSYPLISRLKHCKHVSCLYASYTSIRSHRPSFY
jgi:hypothetical protein